jgi:predicted RNase H-like nuclease (RuvC/YqgF family)
MWASRKGDLMTDDFLAQVLNSLHSLHGEVQSLRHEIAALSATQKFLRDDIHVLQQDTRMVRAALNYLAKENVTSGEVEAIHTDINRLNTRVFDLATEVEIIKRGQA